MHFINKAGTALVAAYAAAFSVTPAAAQDAQSVIGNWRTPSRDGIVEISRCGASICGRLQSSALIQKNPNLKDVKNKDATKRDRALKGIQLISGFRLEGNQWVGGSIYNPEDGGTYKATVTPTGPNSLRLRGCIAWPLCKTQVWTRIP